MLSHDSQTERGEGERRGDGIGVWLECAVIRNQTGASRMEDALTAVITHRHGDHFWPGRGPSSAFNQIGLSVVR